MPGIKSSWMTMIILSVALTILGPRQPAYAAEPPIDAAIVTLVSGGVTYQAVTGQKLPVKVSAFMKLCRDDLVTLVEEARVKLLYLKSGRQELWQGPAAFKLGEKESQAQGGQAVQPQVENLAQPVKNRIVNVALPFDGARIQKAGGTMVRGNDPQPPQAAATPVAPLELTKAELAEIAKAKTEYAAMRKQSAPNDLTPELYLLGVFDAYELYAEMQTLTAELLRQQPDNPFLKAWAEWAQAQTR